VLTLTPRGRAAYARIVPLALEYERRLLAEFSIPERGKLDAMLARLQQRARLLGPAGEARV
jgi:DNA-binding MarR family transcriptional regulator